MSRLVEVDEVGQGPEHLPALRVVLGVEIGGRGKIECRRGTRGILLHGDGHARIVGVRRPARGYIDGMEGGCRRHPVPPVHLGLLEVGEELGHRVLGQEREICGGQPQGTGQCLVVDRVVPVRMLRGTRRLRPATEPFEVFPGQGPGNHARGSQPVPLVHVIGDPVVLLGTVESRTVEVQGDGTDRGILRLEVEVGDGCPQVLLFLHPPPVRRIRQPECPFRIPAVLLLLQCRTAGLQPRLELVEEERFQLGAWLHLRDLLCHRHSRPLRCGRVGALGGVKIIEQDFRQCAFRSSSRQGFRGTGRCERKQAVRAGSPVFIAAVARAHPAVRGVEQSLHIADAGELGEIAGAARDCVVQQQAVV